MVGYLAHGLTELRWELQREGEVARVRLFVSSSESTVFALAWFVKRGGNLEEQRIQQNHACEVAIGRLKEIKHGNNPQSR